MSIFRLLVDHNSDEGCQRCMEKEPKAEQLILALINF